MNDVAIQIKEMAQALESLCSYIDIRDDVNGPFIFAFGHQDTHSLQLRRIKDQFALELWHGKNSEEEVLTSELSCPSAEIALEKAKGWLGRDAI